MRKEKKPLTRLDEIKKDVKKYSSIKVVADSPGGKVIRAGLIKDIITITDKLGANFSSLTMQEFISYSAELKCKKTLLDMFYNSYQNAEGANEALEKYLEQNPENRE